MPVKRNKKRLLNMKSDFEVNLYNSVVDLPNIKIVYEKEKLKYVTEHSYKPDFIVTLNSGRKIYIEAKGYFRATDRSKLVAVREAHPEKDLRIVFQSNSKVHKLSDTRYTDWAEKNGFIHAVGRIPVEWFNE